MTIAAVFREPVENVSISPSDKPAT